MIIASLAPSRRSARGDRNATEFKMINNFFSVDDGLYGATNNKMSRKATVIFFPQWLIASELAPVDNVDTATEDGSDKRGMVGHRRRRRHKNGAGLPTAVANSQQPSPLQCRLLFFDLLSLSPPIARFPQPSSPLPPLLRLFFPSPLLLAPPSPWVRSLFWAGRGAKKTLLTLLLPNRSFMSPTDGGGRGRKREAPPGHGKKRRRRRRRRGGGGHATKNSRQSFSSSPLIPLFFSRSFVLSLSLLHLIILPASPPCLPDCWCWVQNGKSPHKGKKSGAEPDGLTPPESDQQALHLPHYNSRIEGERGIFLYFSSLLVFSQSPSVWHFRNGFSRKASILSSLPLLPLFSLFIRMPFQPLLLFFFSPFFRDPPFSGRRAALPACLPLLPRLR